MKTEIQDLTTLAGHYEKMVQYCTDVIKNLNGYTPDGFTFTFTIHETPVVSIPITEEDGHFCVGVFMSWHQFYSRKLKEINAELNRLCA